MKKKEKKKWQKPEISAIKGMKEELPVMLLDCYKCVGDSYEEVWDEWCHQNNLS